MRSKYGWQRWMATATVVSALAAPSASAALPDGRSTSPALKAYQTDQLASQDTASGNAGGDLRSPDARVAFEAGRVSGDLRSADARVAFESGRVSPSPVAQVAQASSGGFQWSDAGIGAVAMLGAISLCGALFLLSGRRRERHLPRAIG